MVINLSFLKIIPTWSPCPTTVLLFSWYMILFVLYSYYYLFPLYPFFAQYPQEHPHTMQNTMQKEHYDWNEESLSLLLDFRSFHLNLICAVLSILLSYYVLIYIYIHVLPGLGIAVQLVCNAYYASSWWKSMMTYRIPPLSQYIYCTKKGFMSTELYYIILYYTHRLDDR